MVHKNKGLTCARLRLSLAATLLATLLVLIMAGGGCFQSDPESPEAPPVGGAPPNPDRISEGAWHNEVSPPPPPDCGSPAKTWDGLEVYAVSATCPRPDSQRAGADSRAPRELEVLVNRPAGPTALILAADGACRWRVSWTKGSKIEAVVLAGDSPQSISGLGDDSTLLTRPDGRPCGLRGEPGSPATAEADGRAGPEAGSADAEAPDRPDELSLLSLKLFKRPLAEAAVEIRAPEPTAAPARRRDETRPQGPTGAHPVLIGRPLTPGERYYSFTEHLYQPTGQELLDYAERRAWIRPAVAEDYIRWCKAGYEAEARAAVAEGLPAHLIPEFDEANLRGTGLLRGFHYLVLDPRFEIPDGVSGLHFYIPPELPPPYNRGGDNRIYMLKDGREFISQAGEKAVKP